MKIKNEVILENGLEVMGATLLTAVEAVKLSKEIRAIGRWWWLRSPGDYRWRVVIVCSDGFVYYRNVRKAHSFRSEMDSIK